jgi:hypothetical protein
MKTPGALLGIVLAIASTSVVCAADLSGALAQVAVKIERVPAVKGKKVGVGDFPLAGGRVSELSAYFADQLDVALTGRASSGGFEVVTRGQLCQVIRENKLWVDDRFDPSLNKKLGRLGQADVMLTGQVTPLAREVSLSLRLLDTETGKALWADSLKVPLDDGLRALLARAVTGDGCGAVAPTPSATAPTPSADALSVKVSTDKPSYRIGETVAFKVRVNRDAYVTLVDIGTSGEVTIIYPNRLHTSHFVRGGEDVLVPPPDAGFTLTVQGPAGFDQVRAIATEEPVKLHASDFGGQKTIFRSLDRVQTRDLAVTISAEREKIAPGKWAEHTIAVEVRR